MSKKLEAFLVDLGSNPDLLRRVEEDPDGEFAKAGLTADERAALRSGDSEAVRSALGRPHSDHMTQFGFAADVEAVRKKAADDLAALVKRAKKFDVRLATSEKALKTAQLAQAKQSKGKAKPRSTGKGKKKSRKSGGTR
jgi:hypothetical protein